MSPPRTTGDGIDPRIARRRDQVERDRSRRRWRWAAGVGVAAAVVALGALLLHTPLFAARVVRVVGDHPQTPTKTIVAAAGLTGHPLLIRVDPATTAARVETLPLIASASVARHWPDGITITVAERVPSVSMGGPGAAWSTLDGRGRTIAVGPARPVLPQLIVHDAADRPVPPAPVGRTVAPAADPGLIVARTLPAAFAGQVVSINVVKDGTVFLVLHVGLQVLLGTPTELPAKYGAVASIIAGGHLRGDKVLDVTVPQAPVGG